MSYIKVHDGEGFKAFDVGDTPSVLTVVDGKVCCKALQAVGDGWKQLEPSAAIDAPYLTEYGYSLAKQDGTEALYEWVYRCIREGFSVPYRTIEYTDGTVEVYETELTKHSTPFMEGDPELGLATAGVSRDEASYLCVPVAQFGITNEELKRVFDRVRNDNPALCCPPLSDVFIAKNEEKALFAFPMFQTEKTVEKINALIEKASTEINTEVKLLSGLEHRPNTPKWRAAVAKIIHDYIIVRANPDISSTKGGQGNRMIVPWKASAYAVLDNNYGTDDPMAGQQALCDGYSQAFNLFARRYGIVSLVATGMVSQNGTGADGHAWCVCNFYETYETILDENGQWRETEPNRWTPIDVYWDDPLHETVAIGGTVNGTPDVIWKYFCDPRTVDSTVGTLNGVMVTWTRKYTTVTGYGEYPFDGAPSNLDFVIPMEG